MTTNIKNILAALTFLIFVLPVASAEETWKVNLKNADIREFVTQVSTITGKSFVIDPRVKVKVTVRTTHKEEKSSYINTYFFNNIS